MTCFLCHVTIDHTHSTFLQILTVNSCPLPLYLDSHALLAPSLNLIPLNGSIPKVQIFSNMYVYIVFMYMYIGYMYMYIGYMYMYIVYMYICIVDIYWVYVHVYWVYVHVYWVYVHMYCRYILGICTYCYYYINRCSIQEIHSHFYGNTKKVLNKQFIIIIVIVIKVDYCC